MTRRRPPLVTEIAKLAILCLTLDLASCDKFDQFLKKQDNLVKRVDALESEVANLNGRLTASQEKQAENGDSYSSCVLSNMKGVTNDLAAQAVQEICLRKASFPLIDLEPLKSSTAAYGQIRGSLDQRFGLYVTVDNKSDYTLTEISIAVAHKKSNARNTYVAHSFPEPVGQGVIIAGAPKDRTVMMRVAPGRHTFTLPIDETVPDTSKFFDVYTWGIASAKGYIE
jgi:hypothetical protein